MCGLSTRKARTPCLHQWRTTSRSASHSPRQSGAVEVDVVDVLVALGRVLGVLERPVRPPVEPVRMLGEPRVVGGALDREVERDLEPVRARGADEALELRHRPELGVQRVVAALRPADRPRAARIALRRHERVVAPLAVRRPDRMHGRKVDHVEAELRELRYAPSPPPRTRPTSAERARTRRRNAPARGRRPPRAAGRGTPCHAGPWRRAPVQRRASPRAHPARRAPRPPPARSRARSGRRRACGRARRASSRTDRPRPRS